MRLITRDDFTDVYLKVVQRGFKFILSKFNTDGLSRTKSAFDDSSAQSSNWWIIPAVKQRWNAKISGNESVDYEAHTVEKHLTGKKNLRMLSIGSGVSSHELKFAEYDNFEEIICTDIADNLLAKAEKIAAQRKLDNIKFWVKNVYKTDFEPGEFDIIMFHASLHHFSNIEELLTNKVKRWLKPGGFLLINEYVGVNRLQFDHQQIRNINEGLALIPDRLKQRFKTKLLKRRFYGSGYLRMVIADPSECVESSKILPAIKAAFEVVEEKPYGGNLLMNILKDIAHNFTDADDEEAQAVLRQLFELEDAYLRQHHSDFVYGLYRKPLS